MTAALPVTQVNHDYPAIGATVTIKGLVGTQYLHQNETMQVRWSTFWESMADYGFISPVKVELTPDVDQMFPTLGQVMSQIQQFATTAPGERILAVRAVGDTLYLRVGVSDALSREVGVVVPNWSAINQSVSAAAASASAAANSAAASEQSKQTAQANVNAAANAAAQSVYSQLQTFRDQAAASATSAKSDADRAVAARDRAETAAALTDVKPATSSVYGLVKLAGDLGGTADAPTVTGLSGKYVKPGSGIPKSDLASTVQTSLGAADTAYQKPSTGVPKTDLASAVQTSLGNADTAYQKPASGVPKSDLASAVQTSLTAADGALAGPAAGWKTWVGTEAQYQALTTKDSKTLYFRGA